MFGRCLILVLFLWIHLKFKDLFAAETKNPKFRYHIKINWGYPVTIFSPALNTLFPLIILKSSINIFPKTIDCKSTSRIFHASFNGEHENLCKKFPEDKNPSKNIIFHKNVKSEPFNKFFICLTIYLTKKFFWADYNNSTEKRIHI